MLCKPVYRKTLYKKVLISVGLVESLCTFGNTNGGEISIRHLMDLFVEKKLRVQSDEDTSNPPIFGNTNGQQGADGARAGTC